MQIASIAGPSDSFPAISGRVPAPSAAAVAFKLSRISSRERKSRSPCADLFFNRFDKLAWINFQLIQHQAPEIGNNR